VLQHAWVYSQDSSLGEVRLLHNPKYSKYPMKFNSRVAVARDSRIAYWTSAASAERMVRGGMAKRNGRARIDLPGIKSTEYREIAAISFFSEQQPEKKCYGSHTPPNRDRLKFAACFYNAATGTLHSIITSWRPTDAAFTPCHSA
jgi:hypothetical protein